MYIKDGNGTTNHRCHVVRNIQRTIRGMDSFAKETTLLHIKAELFKGATPDPEVLTYVTSLLNGEKPVGINRPQSSQEGGKRCHFSETTGT